MALKATIYKCLLHVSDMNRDYYHSHQLTIAQHPSETDKRMMIRLLAFALNANESLEFTRGLSSDDEPELWLKSLSDEIEMWIELGLPDEKRIRKACGRAKNVVIYSYGGRTAENWWQQNNEKLTKLDNLSVFNIVEDELEQLTSMVERNMQITCTIDDNTLYLNDESQSVNIRFETLLQ